jgi:hypothetical protein
LKHWLDDGGDMPIRLARHVLCCTKCHTWAKRVARVQWALAMLTSQAAPVGIIGRANEKALRMLARKLRDEAEVLKLSEAKPDPGVWPKLEGPLSRTAASAAAAMIILTLRAGVASGVEQTCQIVRPLADCHVERHIYDERLFS